MPDKPAPVVREDKTQGVVFVDDVRVWGFLQTFPTSCGHPNIYSERWDAHFCPVDDRWLEKTCGDPECMYCPGRPDRPSLGRLDEIG